MKRHFFQYGNGNIHYHHTGDGKVILLLHEMPLSSEVFLPMFPFLKDDFCIIAPDYPGFGESSQPENPLTFKEVASLFFDMLDNFGVDSFVIYGVHGGASLGIEMAVQQPDRVESLILSGVPLFTEEERKLFHQKLPKFLIKEDGSHLQEWWKYFEEKFKPAISKEMIHKGVQQIIKAGKNYEWGYREAFNYDPGNGLSIIQLPILLLTANGDVLVDKNKDVLKLTNQVVHEWIVDVPGQLSQRIPEKTSALIKKFLNGVEVDG
ncbi:pimeloyl-ACP methyl ester carboxylesterase [Evansella vedderi]|uniref:Pimeloyl-ACP methyl ester carboxylesterase n=1 Tax=Evansella vedderi TaxID=38282 RepID=A0ABU0A0Q9_9BACI|nr:pimeloyl-ACP methyl ester carboxylesterase [Evansella vedderi]